MNTGDHPPEIPMLRQEKEVLKEDRPILKIENITVARPPLLKIYYWESLDIKSLNEKLLSNENHVEHHLEFPSRQLHSNPLKIVFWLRNLSNFEYIIRVKRLQNCECTPIESRVGFNQYRYLYHCPHRRLITICQDLFVMKPNELLAMTLVSSYYILGKHTLSFELSIAESRLVLLCFHINVVAFDVEKSVLATDLTPVDIKEYRFFSQPLWIQNITTQAISVLFATKSRDINLITTNMTVPPQSVWPLIVQYRPRDIVNSIKIEARLTDKTIPKATLRKYKIPISCKGYIREEVAEYCVPISDYECTEFLSVIYPNRLQFITEINEERRLVVAVHNYDQKCMEFKWQTYSLNKFFSFTFEPAKFILKPHHSKLCAVQVRTFKNPLVFKRICAVIEVHRMQDKTTQIAKRCLYEIESIDDPKWNQSSYVSHAFLHLDLNVKFPKQERINVKELVEESGSVKADSYCEETKYCCQSTIFEKLFWDYLYKSNHMRNTSKMSRTLTYKQVLNRKRRSKKEQCSKIMYKQDVLNTLSCLTVEACRDIAKNYRFVPQQLLDSI